MDMLTHNAVPGVTGKQSFQKIRPVRRWDQPYNIFAPSLVAPDKD